MKLDRTSLLGASLMIGGLALTLIACEVPGTDDPPPTIAACVPLDLASARATGDDGNVPANAIDGDLATRWSSLGVGQALTVDLGAPTRICAVDVAWYRGATRRNRFVVALSTDGASFRDVFAGRSSGRTDALEHYDVTDGDGRFVRLTVNGNSVNRWASIAELEVLGDDGGGAPPGPGTGAAPTIAIAAPVAGAAVSGVALVRGTAADDGDVARVELAIDGGGFVGAAGTAAWSFAWDTAGLAAGAHTLTARATDDDGQQASATVSVTVGAVAPATCDRGATSAATLTSAFAAATAGQTICLASADYGVFKAGAKPGLVTVRAAAGATATMQLDLAGVSNVRLDGLTIRGGGLRGASHDVTIAGSRFTGIFVVDAGQMVNADILFDGNSHADIDTCTSCVAGRLHIDGNNGQPSGITVRRSVFSGGNSDGIRPDADGVQILDNEFFGLVDEEPFHTDPIQLYGGTRTVIRGNYFHDNRTASHIMMADGGRGNVVEGNVFGPSGGWVITWYADAGSIIRHNTFVDGTCSWGRCGVLNIDAKTGARGSGTVIVDNVLTSVGLGPNASLGERHHNLVRSGAVAGEIVGAPIYVGGALPTTYAGFRLTAGSPGKGAASDGTDIGIP